jgi:hypothetical protein
MLRSVIVARLFPEHGFRRAVFVGFGLALGAPVACGVDRPHAVDESTAPWFDAGVFADLDARPQCETLADGGPCGCLELSFLTDVPNLYFVLDRSGSMEADGKWSTVRKVIASTLQKLGPRVRFGAAVFPKSDCLPGIEVMPLRSGDSPAGVRGPAVQQFVSRTNVTAIGGTPTAGTITALTPKLRSFDGRTFVVLATDGGPNCNDDATCDPSGCQANIERFDPSCVPDSEPNCCTPQTYGRSNCLDADPTEAAIKALADSGIPTYVIGVPGSAPYAALLDRLAIAGGTARASAPLYYRVDSTDASALDDAFRAIAAKVTARCDLPLDPPPPDPTRVNVYFDDEVVPADPVNGWIYEGDTVKLVGAACDRVLAGEILNLRVIGGCPTVAPR